MVVDVVAVKGGTSGMVVDVVAVKGGTSGMVVDVVAVKGGTSGMVVDVMAVKGALRILHPLRWTTKLSRRNKIEEQYTQW